MNPTPLFGPVPGGMEMLVILLIAVLLFGADKLPKLARASGEAMGEFKKGREEVERDIREAAQGARDNYEAADPEAELHDGSRAH
ncbi:MULTISPECIES: Sec-independent protein translocase subunit TatA/TatB [Halorussus]|uniref:Sec-independent protein translocase subunit TatA/TatB n=1 Tax=Halorussus TaxID=1070314 RepID=UPI0020A1CC97|nr:twin-arginine translocase TatA/TatE family subunit [Halorussus vallis]USZ76127.1 twin-arginine translocase TatA/TatE family subunit [Halorussus vallis]